MTKSTTKYAIASGYAAKYGGSRGPLLRDTYGTWKFEVESAALFDSIGAALEHMNITRLCDARPVRVVIEETTSAPQESRRVLGETEAAQEGESVKYAIQTYGDDCAYGDKGAFTDPSLSGYASFCVRLDAAPLFNTTADVLTAVAQYGSRKGYAMHNPYGPALARIAVRTIPGGTTVTRRVEEIA